MAELRRRHAELRSLGYTLVALSVDEPARSRAFADQLDLPFPLLCDPSREVVSAWSLHNTREKGGIAFPATFVLDRERTVMFRSLDRTASRVRSDALLAFARGDRGASSDGPRRAAIVPGLRDFFRVTANAIRFGLRSPKPDCCE